MPSRKTLLATAALATRLLPSVSAWSFDITNSPAQCQNITIAITNGAGSPPYSVLIIPSGSSPLPNNVEARRIQAENFTGTSTSVSFRLNYPFNSQFVAVLSDQTGFGAGGTSGAVTVQNSDDTSCYNATESVSPDFVYSIYPTNQIVQCQPTRIWWDPSTVQGTPQFQGVIPGGDSFSITEGSITTVSQEGTGFEWTPSVRAGSTLLIVGGDDRGLGTAGSTPYAVGAGTNINNTCLDSTSPSSTAGSPAGGAYPTNTNGATQPGSNSSSSSTNVGAIAGGVIGGVFALLALALIALFFIRRRRFHQKEKHHVDLLQDAGDGHQNTGLPQYYLPEPFVVPEPTEANYSGRDTSIEYTRASTDTGTRPLSSAFSGPEMASLLGGASSVTSSSRKGALANRPMRPVNVIQHDDAGPSDAHDDEAETVELPPAYTNLKRGFTRRTANTEAETAAQPAEAVAAGGETQT